MPDNSSLHCLQAGMPAHGDADAPGAVQKLLADFLARCPAGVVILERAERLHPRLVPVWINALSEQARDGFLYLCFYADGAGDAGQAAMAAALTCLSDYCIALLCSHSVWPCAAYPCFLHAGSCSRLVTASAECGYS